MCQKLRWVWEDRGIRQISDWEEFGGTQPCRWINTTRCVTNAIPPLSALGVVVLVWAVVSSPGGRGGQARGKRPWPGLREVQQEGGLRGGPAVGCLAPHSWGKEGQRLLPKGLNLLKPLPTPSCFFLTSKAKKEQKKHTEPDCGNEGHQPSGPPTLVGKHQALP